MADEAGTSSGLLKCKRDDREYDVFLNFRGPDSRDTVIDVLYSALIRAGSRVFLDNEEIRKGEVIEGELLSAIINSKIYIPIFSKDYASSKWCLRELAKMLNCWENSSGKTKKVILPVFYQVDVSKDLKLKSDVYLTSLQVHKTQLGNAAVEPWEAALRKVANISGWNLKDHGLVRLADLVKEEVCRIINASEATPIVSDGFVGIHERIEAIMPLFDERSLGVQFIVIHGMGGIGKTTLAKSIFKKFSSNFQGSCFLQDIGQSSSEDDMVKLQKKLLSDTINLKPIKIFDACDGTSMIRNKLHKRKVLIILDDVDKWDHLRKLAAKSDWFGPKSKIIITTRNIDFLPANDSKYYFYRMEELNHGHALQLFCWHAFEHKSPPPKYYDISREMVATTGGLPLAIQVIGSSLYNQEDGTWKFRLEKLKEAPHKDVQEKLMISYQALEDEQQQIFLDIACFFNSKEKIDPIYFWEACKFYPDSGIEILVRRSLIKVNDGDILWMHDQLRDLGRAIAQSKSQVLSYQGPINPSRLWCPKVALYAVRRKEVAKSVVALNLETLDANYSFIREEYAGAINLKFLQLKGGNFEGDFENVFQQLRWLSWSNCPIKIEATNLSFEKLVVLKLSHSNITEDWGGWTAIMVAKQLKVLKLTSCKCLTKMPDFSTFLGLERLVLNYCDGLKEIDKSIAKLKHLEHLEILGALTELHASIGELVNLKHLRLRRAQLESIPDSIGKLMLLEELDLSRSGIKELPDSIGDLKQLKILRMTWCYISYLPDSIGRLESLKELHMDCTYITMLPETIENLKSLEIINLTGCGIVKLPKVIGNVEKLEELYVGKSMNEGVELPEEIGKLSCLKVLRLSFLEISKVPTTINHLSHLQNLKLSTLSELPESLEFPTSLTRLVLEFSSSKLHKIHDLSYMTNLVTLKLSGPDSREFVIITRCYGPVIGLPGLQELTLKFSDVIPPTTQLSSPSQLPMQGITYADQSSLTHLPSNLERLRLTDVRTPSQWQAIHLRTLELWSCEFTKVSNLSCLKELCILNIYDCRELVEIPDLGQVESLQTLQISQCPFISRLPDLSGLKKLERLSFLFCPCLESVPNINEETSCYLIVWDCEHFDDYDGPYKKLQSKNNRKTNNACTCRTAIRLRRRRVFRIKRVKQNVRLIRRRLYQRHVEPSLES